MTRNRWSVCLLLMGFVTLGLRACSIALRGSARRPGSRSLDIAVDRVHTVRVAGLSVASPASSRRPSRAYAPGRPGATPGQGHS